MNAVKQAINALSATWIAGRTILASLAGVLAAGGALAADTNLLDQRFQLSIGTFTNASSLKIQVDGEAGEVGTPVDWDSTFGDEDKTRLRVDGLWRIANRHYVRFMYTDYSRSDTSTIEEDIIWQGDEIPVGATATGKFAFEIIEVAYEYAFVKSTDLEVTGSIGLHYTSLEATLKAEVDVGDEEFFEQRGGRASANVPLPVIGARSLWRFHDNFYLDVLAQAFYLSFDDFDGSILNLRAALTWQPRSWIGLGVGYDWFNIDVDADASRFKGEMDWTYKGPQVFLSTSF